MAAGAELLWDNELLGRVLRRLLQAEGAQYSFDEIGLWLESPYPIEISDEERAALDRAAAGR